MRRGHMATAEQPPARLLPAFNLGFLPGLGWACRRRWAWACCPARHAAGTACHGPSAEGRWFPGGQGVLIGRTFINGFLSLFDLRLAVEKRPRGSSEAGGINKLREAEGIPLL